MGLTPTPPHERPRLRGAMHALVFFAAIPAAIFLILHAHRATAIAAASVYAASVLALFGTSAGYHRLTRSPKATAIMQRLDHSMIYVLIAGTYTPICLLALPRAWGIPILAIVGVGALIGVATTVFAFNRWRILHYALYPIMGWIAVAAGPQLADSLTGTQLALIVAGGVLYTAGFPVLLTEKPNPWPKTFGYHEVWHSFTVAAGACHFAAVALIVS
ncbi:MAG: hemolysin III family protein [Acidimicrobiia bacterium]